MEKTVQAVYENGVLRPLDPLPLAEHQEVTISISEALGDADPLSELVVPASKWEVSGELRSHEEVRRALSGISGSLADAVVEERRERW